tara:strand:+ start:790 stop:993 length:204 start_codon:yes stop_codon:yes gene_type:complete
MKVNMTIEVTDEQRRILYAKLEGKRGMATREMVREYMSELLASVCEVYADAVDNLPERRTWKERSDD